MKVYIKYFRLRIMTFLQYRTSAMAGLTTQFFWGMMLIFIYIAFYSTDTQVGINLEQIITYTWLHQACYALIGVRLNDNEIATMIRDGSVAYEIIRPYNLYFWWYIKTVAKRIASGLLRMFPVIIVALLLSDPYRLSLPSSFLNFLLFFISLILGILLVSAINMLIYTIGFYTYNEAGISGIMYSFMELLSGGLVPVVLLPVILQKATYYLPFRLISDFPFRVYTNNIGINEGLISLELQIIWIVFLLFIGNLIVKKSLRKVFVQGG